MRRECFHYIGSLMFEADKTRRYIKEKIALAALLVTSLLVALLVVELRSVIRLTAPIELSRSGLSVSMPQGNGWRCDGKWTYGDGGFTLNSVFAVRASEARSYARCHYILAVRQRTAQEQFDEDAATIGGKVVETGRMETGPSASPGGEQTGAGKLVVEWARISGEDGLEMVSGVCGLAGGRQLEIDVLQTGDEPGLTQNIFERIVKGIRFNDNGLLQAGAQVVSDVIDAGARGFADDNQPSFFILSDTKGKAIGFTMDSIEVRADVEPALRAASYLYIRVPVVNEEAGVFRGDAAFKQFDWRIGENSPRAGRKVIEISADSGVLTVRKSDTTSSREKEYVLGEASVPDIVLEPILQKVLGNGPREIVIDVIRSEGVITPVYIEKIIESDSNSLKLEVLDGSGYRQQIYYDDAGQSVKIVLEQQGTYTLNRATADEIAKTFPERANLVLKQDLGREGI
ncbi:MAG: hypothetical protein ABII09_09580 [Planctomycetota bacterium]